MKQRVLVVEDNNLNQRILHKILHTEYEVEQAYNGAEALTIIQKEYLDLAAVILDLRMPVMDGWQLLNILSKDPTYQNLAILIATGEPDDRLESHCLKAGAWDFVTKPYNAEVIRLRLRNIIGRSQVDLIKQIRRLSERDRLTNLYNREFFMASTKRMILADEDTTYALVRMDIDNFRLFNSSFGSEAGDELLKKIAEGLAECKSEKRIYGRIESDVFCICLPYHVDEIYEFIKYMEAYTQKFCVNYRLKFSFGIFVISDPYMDMEKMYSCTVEAARSCKRRVNCTSAVYDEKMSEQEAKYQRITNEMEEALRREQFLVFLQPKYSLETEKPCGAEALVRWKHPDQGMISPGDFIPVFEKNGQILQLDYYMWEHVCMLLQKWIREGLDPYPVSVNISRVSLYNPKIVEELEELTQRYEIPRHLLNLEITESAYMSNPDLMQEIIAKLRDKGFVLMMDDFGSGYSSLNTLKEIQMDILKIDMKFLPSGADNVKSEKILASVIRMAGWIGMPVIVEGVETKQQKEFLDSIGCSYVQGFYFAKPMPVEHYETLMKSSMEGTKNHQDTREPMSVDLDDIWSSDAKSVTLLKSVSIPFAIFEYDNEQMDLLRVNKAYIEQFGSGNTMNRLLNSNEIYKLKAAMNQVLLTKEDAECECLYIMPNGKNSWYRIRLLYLGTSLKTSLISATFMDVSTERMMEKELDSVFSFLKKSKDRDSSLLIVDDAESSRAILAGIFGDEYNLLMAEDGEEGLELLKSHTNQIAAVLLDMVMPRMSGQEFLSFKNDMPDAVGIPVVVISADTNENLQVNMLKNGVNDYVTKPFIPAMVKQRVHNVIEYNSRFRALVREFREVNLPKKTDDTITSLNLTGYSVEQLHDMMQFMTEIFDVVRLVDPDQTSVITIQPDRTIRRTPYSCFQIWGKERRCENCSSLCAKQGKCVMTKYELMRNSIFYVVSRPVQIRLDMDLSENLVLEVASKISHENALQLIDNDSFQNILEHTREMIYVDPLTEAYNRRYFDEMLFLQKGQSLHAKQVGFIMLDLYKFKQINDLFGHQTGDRVLREVVSAMKVQIRAHDSVIRYGGDEFVVTLTNCPEEQVKKAVERLREAVRTVHYGPNNTVCAEADFGYSYTDSFERDKEMLEQYVNMADVAMYEDKNKYKQIRE